MATTQIRYATLTRLKTLFETNSSSTVLLSYGFPAKDNRPPECAYVVTTEGDHEILAFAARTPREDKFIIHVEIQAEIDGQDDATAYSRVEQIFAWFENAVADNPVNLGTVDGLKAAQITRVEGPNIVGTNLGWHGYLNFHLTCIAHYT